MTRLIINKSEVDRIAKEVVKHVSNDFYDELADKIVKLVLEAGERAKANGRTTLMRRDL